MSSTADANIKEKIEKEVSHEKTPDFVDEDKSNIEINNNMATFTFVDILISQKHYSNALQVLKVLEKNGRDQSKINRVREQISQKLEK